MCDNHSYRWIWMTDADLWLQQECEKLLLTHNNSPSFCFLFCWLLLLFFDSLPLYSSCAHTIHFRYCISVLMLSMRVDKMISPEFVCSFCSSSFLRALCWDIIFSFYLLFHFIGYSVVFFFHFICYTFIILIAPILFCFSDVFFCFFFFFSS